MWTSIIRIRAFTVSKRKAGRGSSFASGIMGLGAHLIPTGRRLSGLISVGKAGVDRGLRQDIAEIVRLVGHAEPV
jgi:hypothetical protein